MCCLAFGLGTPRLVAGQQSALAESLKCDRLLEVGSKAYRAGRLLEAKARFREAGAARCVSQQTFDTAMAVVELALRRRADVAPRKRSAGAKASELRRASARENAGDRRKVRRHQVPAPDRRLRANPPSRNRVASSEARAERSATGKRAREALNPVPRGTRRATPTDTAIRALVALESDRQAADFAREPGPRQCSTQEAELVWNLPIGEEQSEQPQRQGMEATRAQAVAMVKKLMWKTGTRALGNGLVLYVLGRDKEGAERRQAVRAGLGVTPRGAGAEMTLRF